MPGRMYSDKMKAFLWVRSRKGAIAWSAVLLLPLLLRLLNPVMVLWSILLLLFLSPWGSARRI